jgi:hypothetical protein
MKNNPIQWQKYRMPFPVDSLIKGAGTAPQYHAD